MVLRVTLAAPLRLLPVWKSRPHDRPVLRPQLALAQGQDSDHLSRVPDDWPRTVLASPAASPVARLEPRRFVFLNRSLVYNQE